MLQQTETRTSVALVLAIALTLVVAKVCYADPFCDDNSELSPYVCVDKDGPDPVPPFDFVFDFQTDADNPGVTFFTGNDGWVVWSQVSETDETPANLGAIGIDPTLPTANFSVTVAHGEQPGAANVGSIVLETDEWTGHSSIAGGRISGGLTGDLTVQESSGEGGTVSFTVDGNVEGDITGGTISALSIGGNLSLSVVKIYDVTGTMSVAGHFLSGGGSFAAHDISGSLSIGGNAYGQMHLGVFTGSLSVAGDVGFDMLTIWGSGSGNITGGAVTGAYVVLSEDEGHTYSGTATFSSVGSNSSVEARAPLSGTIHVTGNVAGSVDARGDASNPGLTETGLIDIGGDLSGDVVVWGDALGDIEIGENITSTGDVVVNDMSGDLTVGGHTLGDIHIAELSGSLSIDGDLLGDITVTQKINGGTLHVWGDVGANADVEIADMLGSASLTFGQGNVPRGEFSGDLALLTGVPEGTTVKIYGPLTPVGQHTPTIELNEQDVAGQLLIPGGGTGDIINGGAVTGTVGLAEATTFSGTATFASVAPYCDIKACFSDIDGTVHITGNMHGKIWMSGGVQEGGGNLNGNIQVDGYVSGIIDVFVDASGQIHVNGGLPPGGWINVHDNISGTVEIHGYTYGEILANADEDGGAITGPVTVDGEFGGNICADNLYPDECLPENINIQSFGPDWTVCDEPGCICDLDAPTTPSGEEGFDKNRYLSFVPGNAGLQTALRLTLQGSALQWWVGEPEQFCENAGQDSPPPGGCGPAPGLPSTTFMGAHRVCEPHFADWPADVGSGVALHVYGEDIVPGETYEVQAIGENCDPEIESNYSPALTVTMTLWGDVCGAFREGRWNPPDGSVDVTTDVAAMLDKFRNLAGAPIKARCDVDPELVQQIVDITDIDRVLDAFRGFPYPFDPPSSGCN